MKSPAGHMANHGVSSYEHMMDSARPAHMGSKNSEAHSMSGGSAPGPGAHMAPTGLHNFAGHGHMGTVAKAKSSMVRDTDNDAM